MTPREEIKWERFIESEGQSKMICDKSQRHSSKWKVQKGESFKFNL